MRTTGLSILPMATSSEDFYTTSGIINGAGTYSGMPAIFMLPELDITQVAITRGANAWTVAVASLVGTVDTIVNHKFSSGQTIRTDANWTDNAWMAGLTLVITGCPTTHSFTFATAHGDQGATVETNVAATITPGEFYMTLSPSSRGFPKEFFVLCSTAGTVTTQAFFQFGYTTGGAEYLASTQTTQLTTGNGINGIERFSALLTGLGSQTISFKMATAGVVAAGTHKVRFGVILAPYVENQ